MPILRPFEVRLFASVPVTNATPYRVLLYKSLSSARWHITRTDGYADATLTLHGTIDEQGNLANGRCIEFWGRDKTGVLIRLYRGKVVYLKEQRRDTGTRAGKSLVQTEVTLLGIWNERKQTVIRQRYVYPSAADVSAVFSRLASKWILPKSPGIAIDPQPTGQTISSLDAWRRYFGDVVSDLIDATGGDAVSGGDVDPVSNLDRLYLRPFDSPANALTLVFPDPSKGVLRYDKEQDATQISNVIDLAGGAGRFPNLLAEAVNGNTSFEYPTFAGGENIGELLAANGFDNGGTTSSRSVSNLLIHATTNGQSHIRSTNTGSLYMSDKGKTLTITGGSGWVIGTYEVLSTYQVADPFVGPQVVLIVNGVAAPKGSTGGSGDLSATGAFVLSGDADLVESGGLYGNTDGGNYMVYLENEGGSVFMPFGPGTSIASGKTYRFRVRLRLESGSDITIGNRVKLRVQWTDNSNVVIGTDTEITFDDDSGLDTAGAWSTFTLDSICPASATKGRVYVIFDDKPVGAVGGILVDNPSFSNASDVVQTGWETNVQGTASVSEVDWAYEGTGDDTAVHGAYSVRLKVVSSDDQNNCVRLRPIDDTSFGVLANQSLTFSIWVKRPAFSLTNRPKCRLHLVELNANNDVLNIESADFAATSSYDWQFFSVSRVVDAACRAVRVTLLVLGSGDLLADAAMVRDGAADGDPFVESSDFTGILSATDVFDSGSAEYQSAATWGEITELVDEQSITTEEDMNRYGVVRLARTATPFNRPPIETVKFAYPFFPGIYLRAVGADAERILPEPLPILEVEGEWNATDLIRMRPIVGTERKSENRVTRDIVKRQLLKEGRNGTGASSGGSASSLTFGGTAGISAVTVQDEGSSLTMRPLLNFIGSGVTVADNVGNGSTDVTIPGASGTAILGDFQPLTVALLQGISPALLDPQPDGITNAGKPSMFEFVLPYAENGSTLYYTLVRCSLRLSTCSTSSESSYPNGTTVICEHWNAAGAFARPNGGGIPQGAQLGGAFVGAGGYETLAGSLPAGNLLGTTPQSGDKICANAIQVGAGTDGYTFECTFSVSTTDPAEEEEI